MRTASSRRRGQGWRQAFYLVFVLLGAGAAGACGDDGLGPNPEDVEFAASLGIDLAQMTRLPSGVYVQTVTQGTGTGTVAATSHITMAYQGWLADGTSFDQSDSYSDFANVFVPGFTDGLIGMKVGEVRKIVIPADLGYGPDDYRDIPGNSVLVFQVTLKAIG